MKSLAFSLACVATFATPGLCGDLGRADIATRNDLAIENSFSANCYGSLDKPVGPECSVDFSDGKMSVDGSSGITPDQIVSINENFYPSGYFINLQYNTSEGETSIAQFSFLKKATAKQFMNTAVLFMSGSSLSTIPESSESDSESIVVDTPEVKDVIEPIQTDECTGPTILCF